MITSCLEKDPRIGLPGPTELFLQLDPKSTNRVFISIQNKKVVKEYPVDSVWHLKFQNGENDWAIFLNPHLDVSLHKTNITNYSEVDYSYILDNLTWQRDIPLSSTVLPAFGTWGDYNFENPKSFKNIYILKARIGLNLSYYKIQILDALDGNFSLRYGKLDGSVDHTTLIRKDHNYSHSYLVLGSSPKPMEMEPYKNLWEFCITYGIDSLSKNQHQPPLKELDDFIGVFQLINLNKNSVKLHIVRDISFEEIDYFYAKNLSFNNLEQIPNVFAVYNFQRQIYEAAKRTTVVFKLDDRLYKVKASNVSSISPEAVSIMLSIESL